MALGASEQITGVDGWMGDTPKTVTTMVGSVRCAIGNAYRKIREEDNDQTWI